MPKLGMAPIRRQQLIAATIAVIAEQGFSNITVAHISRAAGVSAGIIHHYFGGKNELLEAAMRSILQDLRARTSERLAGKSDPRERLRAIIDANFAGSQFSAMAVRAWLAFWSQAPYVPALDRLQRVNAARLRSNLCHVLKQLLPEAEARRAATTLAVLIDGLSLRSALEGGVPDAETARTLVLSHAERLLT
jgi:TetR/AcrR family transcriptional repressor of bet genes